MTNKNIKLYIGATTDFKRRYEDHSRVYRGRIYYWNKTKKYLHDVENELFHFCEVNRVDLWNDQTSSNINEKIKGGTIYVIVGRPY